jgi:phage shock protein PspC (stress-responsive transcriptional regulator)
MDIDENYNSDYTFGLDVVRIIAIILAFFEILFNIQFYLCR